MLANPIACQLFSTTKMLAGRKDWNPSCPLRFCFSRRVGLSLRQSTEPFRLKFTIDKRPDLGYHFVCYLEQTRHPAPPLTLLDSALTGNVESCTILVQISPLESALTDTPLASPLESALTKTPGVGVPQHFRACPERTLRRVAEIPKQQL
jgi:hypothetical protein